ncbi:MAG: DEAD/DEAH box helicase [Acidobacteriota bacterium]|nr:DEAD/DEAH box helicase [Acidobacteriota bacterium]
MASGTLAPGARVLIRDAEWIVKRVDPTGTGGKSIQVVGVSQIVRHKEARFLSEIEGKGITVLDPAETELVPDASPQFRNSRLYLESLLRQSPPTGNDLWIGHRAAIDDLPFQLDPALLALEQPRQRILMADAVGLGKTIEMGILLSELINRGKGKRILVVTTKSMMAQFQKELWARFTIPLVRLDSLGLERVRSRIPTNANPFHYFDKAIISIDTLKQNAEFRVWADKSYWDAIVIDEAHNVAFRGSTLSLRAKLADLLSRRSDTLIMASATPHDGKAASFASLMNMLNPTAIANPDDYGPDDIKGLFLRRYKKHIQDQVSGSFLERQVSKHAVAASPEEEAAYDRLADARFLSFDHTRRTGQLLFKTVLEKALFSSPAACMETIRQRLRKIEKETGADADQDRVTLGGLTEALERIGPANFAKYRRLVDMLKPGGSLHWDPTDPADRVVLFTERIETLRFLEQNLAHDLKLKPAQIAVVHGSGIEDVDLQQMVEDFGRDGCPVRLMLASDIASEGLNLHFLCHKLIHFDIPWSLMVFQQRNGRIDRYGQEKQPLIAYLYTEPEHPKVRGDLRILELLMEKDAQAATNIGDPSVFLGVFDAREEELMTGKAIEENLAPTEFNQKMEKAAEDDLLSILLGDAPIPVGETVRSRCHTFPSLFADDLVYFQEGLSALSGSVDLQADFDPERQMVTLTVDEDLRRAFRALPREAIPEDGRLHLTTNRDRVKKAIKDSRAEEDNWPHIQLLWDLHPIMEWLNFKLMVAFGRKQAPAMRLGGALAAGESLFLIQGEIPNRKGQPVIHEWFAIRFDGQRNSGVLPLQDFLKLTQLDKRTYPNPGEFEVPVSIQSLLPQAVEEARHYMSSRRREFQENLKNRLNEEIRNLETLQGRQMSFLEFEYPEDLALVGVRRNKKLERKRHIDAVFASYRRWVEDTLTTEDSPFLRVAAVFLG